VRSFDTAGEKIEFLITYPAAAIAPINNTIAAVLTVGFSNTFVSKAIYLPIFKPSSHKQAHVDPAHVNPALPTLTASSNQLLKFNELFEHVARRCNNTVL